VARDFHRVGNFSGHRWNVARAAVESLAAEGVAELAPENGRKGAVSENVAKFKGLNLAKRKSPHRFIRFKTGKYEFCWDFCVVDSGCGCCCSADGSGPTRGHFNAPWLW